MKLKHEIICVLISIVIIIDFSVGEKLFKLERVQRVAPGRHKRYFIQFERDDGAIKEGNLVLNQLDLQ